MDGPGEVTCLAVDLFGLRGSRPNGLSEGAARAGDIVFGNQTRLQIEALRREHRLRRLLARVSVGTPADEEVATALAEGPRTVRLALLGYRASPADAGAMKPFDFSPRTLAERWESGEAVMRAALARLGERADVGAFVVEEVDG